MFHNIIYLHGCVSLYIQHLTHASTILLSWEETQKFGRNIEYRIMNVANMISKNIVNSVGTFNNSVAMNNISGNSIGMNNVSYEYYRDEQCFMQISSR